MSGTDQPMPEWSFLSNHGLTLLCIARNPDVRIRDIAVDIDVTERTAHRLVSDLVHEGYVMRERIGRRNRYEIEHEAAMRHPMLSGYWIGEFVAVLADLRTERREASGRVKPG